MEPGWEREVKFHEGWDLGSCGSGGIDGSGGGDGGGLGRGGSSGYVMLLCILYLKSIHKIVYNKKLINID